MKNISLQSIKLRIPATKKLKYCKRTSPTNTQKCNKICDV